MLLKSQQKTTNVTKFKIKYHFDRKAQRKYV